MKKTLRNIFGLLVLASTVLFTSCFDSVFYEITQDVPPETATVSGPITSITRFAVDDTEFLVTIGNHPSDETQRGLRYKKASENQHGAWKTFPIADLPFELHHYDYYGIQNHVGHQLVKTAADKDNLYVVSVEYENNKETGTSCPKKVHLWQAQFTLDANSNWKLNGNWKDLNAGDFEYLPLYIYKDYSYSAFNVFCTNSVNPDHRVAFIRYGTYSVPNEAPAEVQKYKISEIYTLKGNAEPEKIGAINAFEYNAKKAAKTNYNINSAIYYPSTKSTNDILFFATPASITNELKDTEPTRFYYNNGKELWYSDENSVKTQNSGIEKLGENLLSIAINKDSLLMGKGNLQATASSSSGGGIERVELTDGVPGDKLGVFKTNAKSQLLSSYFVTNLLAVDPSKTELENSIYGTIEFIGSGAAASVSFKNVGLWAYYADRGNWNRE